MSVVSIGEPHGSITRGLWFASVNEVGPFSDAGAPAGETTVTASMRTAGFDPAVTSSTDDPFRISVDPTSDALRHPGADPAGSGRGDPGHDHPAGQEGIRGLTVT